MINTPWYNSYAGRLIGGGSGARHPKRYEGVEVATYVLYDVNARTRMRLYGAFSSISNSVARKVHIDSLEVYFCGASLQN